MISEEIEPQKNQKLASISNWGPAWKVSFEILISQYTEDDNFKNIFHFTATGKDCCDIGDRLPGLWLSKENVLYLGTHIGTNGDHVVKTGVVSKNVWHAVKLEQKLDNQKVKISSYFLQSLFTQGYLVAIYIYYGWKSSDNIGKYQPSRVYKCRSFCW